MYERQTVECGGISYTEYSFESEENVNCDNELDLTKISGGYKCFECTYFEQGICQLKNICRNRNDDACEELEDNSPF